MKIAIAGYGVEGEASYRYFRTHYPEAQIAIVDQTPPTELPLGVEVLSGENVFSRLDDFDLVVRTPSLAPAKIKSNGKIWSATNEFFAKCPAPIIGVTGTKGKGTTCSLISSILKAAGKNVHLVGNIGAPALDILDQISQGDIVVYELSSFQLWDLEKSPQIAVVLMIEPDHLDIHEDFDDYINAKANIRRYQNMGNDVCIYHPTSRYAEQIAGTILIRQLAEANEVQLSPDSLHINAHKYAVPGDDEVYIEDGYFMVQGRRICSTDNLQLPGQHNLENACAAISAVTELAIWPQEITDQQVAEGLRNFTGLPHRLKFIREVAGVKYYDDSIATTPGSAIAALRSFTQPKVLILGGHDKGADYTEMITEITRQNIRSVILIGENSNKHEKLLANSDCQILKLGYVSMAEVVKAAQDVTQSGDVVILSPAAASFDMFKSYSDRGEQFVEAVNQLAGEQPAWR